MQGLLHCSGLVATSARHYTVGATRACHYTASCLKPTQCRQQLLLAAGSIGLPQSLVLWVLQHAALGCAPCIALFRMNGGSSQRSLVLAAGWHTKKQLAKAEHVASGGAHQPAPLSQFPLMLASSGPSVRRRCCPRGSSNPCYPCQCVLRVQSEFISSVLVTKPNSARALGGSGHPWRISAGA